MLIDRFLVSEQDKLLDVLKVINNNGKSIACVCANNHFKGIVTDGDIRRFILSNGNLDTEIRFVANYNPIYLHESERYKVQTTMQELRLEVLPIVNSNMELTDICFWNSMDETSEKKNLNIPLVIMAGGKGTRLKPYTDILPKPLMPIGGITITEHIIKKFKKYNCTSVYMIVNYMKGFIKSYFLEKQIEPNIIFIDELEFLGTGGGLKLLKGKLTETFFMTNCDIIIEADYSKILNYHRARKNIITMVCARKEITIPYGTIEITELGDIVSLHEKPKLMQNVNTGFYIIEPEFLDFIPENQFIHITDIIIQCMEKKKKVGAYLVNESDWMDMGQLEELEKVKSRMEYLQ